MAQKQRSTGIVVSTFVNHSRIANLFTSAIEGGDPVTTASKGGWCGGIFWKSQKAEPPAGVWYAKDVTFAGNFKLEIVEIDEATGRKRSHFITRRHVREGMSAMASVFPHQFCQIINDEIDAPCADAFLQAVLFGKEKYS